MTFFQDLTFFLNNYLSTNDKVVVIGDFNIHVKEVASQILEKLKTFWATFGLSNLVKAYTTLVFNINK